MSAAPPIGIGLAPALIPVRLDLPVGDLADARPDDRPDGGGGEQRRREETDDEARPAELLAPPWTAWS